MKPTETKPIIVYGHSFCGAVPTVRKILEAANAPYKYLDITLHADASQHVAEINNGNYSVPTLVFPDKSTLTEPSTVELVNKLQGMGLTIDARALRSARRPSVLRSPAFWVMIMIVLYGVLRVLEVV